MLSTILPVMFMGPVLATVVALIPRQRLASEIATVLGTSVAFGGALLVALGGVAGGGRVTALGGLLSLDALGAVFLLMVALVAFSTAIYSIGYVRHEYAELPTVQRRRETSRFYLLFNLFTLSMLAVPSLNNLTYLWVAVEVTTIVSALMVSLEGSDEALEAAWKYIVIASAGLALALFGVILLYVAGTDQLGASYAPNWTALLAVAGHLPPHVVQLAFLFALIGFGTKVGLVPMHTWLPDAHSEGPSPVSALLSGALLADALYAILRFGVITARAVSPAYVHGWLLAFGIVSLLAAAFFALRQRNYKRLLAYSSIEHMGIISVGLGIGVPIALYGALLHVLAHAATKSQIFYGAGSILRRYGTREISEVRGVLALMPTTGVLLLVSMLAISGAPPFGIFRSELLIVTGALSGGGLMAVGGVLLIAITLVFLGLSWPFLQMLLGTPAENLPKREVSGWLVAAMLIDLAVMVLLGVGLFGPLSALLHQAAAILA